MNPIPRTHLPLYADRIAMLGELRLSAENAVELIHGYGHFLVMRTMLTQMAEGANSNADFAKWASALLRKEKEGRSKLKLRHPKRLVTVEAV